MSPCASATLPPAGRRSPPSRVSSLNLPPCPTRDVLTDARQREHDGHNRHPDQCESRTEFEGGADVLRGRPSRIHTYAMVRTIYPHMRRVLLILTLLSESQEVARDTCRDTLATLHPRHPERPRLARSRPPHGCGLLEGGPPHRPDVQDSRGRPAPHPPWRRRRALGVLGRVVSPGNNMSKCRLSDARPPVGGSRA